MALQSNGCTTMLGVVLAPYWYALVRKFERFFSTRCLSAFDRLPRVQVAGAGGGVVLPHIGQLWADQNVRDQGV